MTDEDAEKAWEAYEESDAFAKDRTEVMHLPVDSVDTGPHSARAIGLSEALGDDVAGDIAYDALLLGFNAGRASVHDNFDSLRSRIGALESVIAQVRSLRQVDWGMGNAGLDARSVQELLDLAPSVVLDQVIREAKAEAVEAARDAIMPPVNWNLRPDGTEMPGTQHIDEALRDIHVQLSAVAAEYRNEER